MSVTFRQLIAAHTGTQEELPLIHTSRCEHVEAIITSNALTPRYCSVFKESVLYFFYGRPAYRPSAPAPGGDIIPLCPVCFVFKPRTVSTSLCRVFPCDSGAISQGLFDPHIASSAIAELELDPHIDSARRLVSAFFQTNRDYFVGKVRTGVSCGSCEMATKYYGLINAPRVHAFDDRKSAIEIQTHHPASLAGHLLFVVLPNEFLEVPHIRSAILNEWNCDPIGYPTYNGDSPTSYFSVVREMVHKRFCEATRI